MDDNYSFRLMNTTKSGHKYLVLNKQVVVREKMALFVISQDCQTQVLAANAMGMATSIIID